VLALRSQALPTLYLEEGGLALVLAGGGHTDTRTLAGELAGDVVWVVVLEDAGLRRTSTHDGKSMR